MLNLPPYGQVGWELWRQVFELDMPPKASSVLSDVVLPGLAPSALMIRHFLQSYGCGGVIESVLIRHLFK